MRPRISLLQCLEVMTLFAISMGLDRLLFCWDLYIPRSILVLAFWGGIGGTYLGIRWRRKQGFVTTLALALVTSVVMAFTNAVIVAGVSSEILRISGDFDWWKDWAKVYEWIGVTNAMTVVVSLILIYLAEALFGPFGRGSTLPSNHE